MTNALIVYGTRYGATADTSKAIAEILRKERFEVKVVNLKRDKVKNITQYELVMIGSGIQMNKWTGEPEKFLKKFEQELAKKKVALFVCCGSTHPLAGEEEKNEAIARARTKYLEEKAAKYNLHPIALGLFGGAYNFNNMSWFLRKTMSSLKSQLEEAGIKETQPGVYDIRNWDAIHNWAKEVAQIVQS